MHHMQASPHAGSPRCNFLWTPPDTTNIYSNVEFWRDLITKNETCIVHRMKLMKHVAFGGVKPMKMTRLIVCWIEFMNWACCNRTKFLVSPSQQATGQCHWCTCCILSFGTPLVYASQRGTQATQSFAPFWKGNDRTWIWFGSTCDMQKRRTHNERHGESPGVWNILWS